MPDQNLEITYLVEVVDKASKTLDSIDKSVKNIEQTVARADKAMDDLGQTTKKTSSFFGGLIGSVAKTAATFGLIGGSIAILNKLFKSTVKFNFQILSTRLALDGFIQRWPVLGKVVDVALRATSRVGIVLSQTLLNSSQYLGKFIEGLKGGATTAKNIGSAFFGAAKKTELFEKGIFGATARVTGLSAGLAGLGRLLLDADGVLGKISGTTLIAFSVALGGIVVLIRSFIVTIGEMIEAVGDKLVTALQHSVDEFVQMEQTTLSFQYVMENLSEETRGAIGTLEEWNNIINEFVTRTGFGIEETQRSVSEMLRFGESIGLTRKQMENLLPLIGDVAVANHKDLFDSTIAVVEALNGQTVMLQNMGINLSATAIKQGEASDAAEENFNKLTNLEKTQLRYNALMKESSTVTGIASKAMDSISGQLRRQENIWKTLNASLGKGAEIIEQKVNVAMTALIEILGNFSQSGLQAIGFLGALTGRVLQVTGLFVKWSFAIVLVVSSYRALNALLASQAIQKYILSLAQANIITKTLAASNAGLAKTISGVLTTIGTTGLKFTSLGAIATTVLGAISKAAFVILLPLIKIVAIVGLVVGAFYLIYEALKRVDEVTGIFSDTWAELVAWWQDTTVFDRVAKAFQTITKVLRIGLVEAIFFVSKAFFGLIIVVNKAVQLFLEAKAKIRDFFYTIIDGLAVLPGKVLSVLGISTAYADELKKTSERQKGLTAAEEERFKNLEFNINQARGYIGELEDNRKKEIVQIINAKDATQLLTEKEMERLRNLKQIEAAMQSISRTKTGEFLAGFASGDIEEKVKKLQEGTTVKLEAAKSRGEGISPALAKEVSQTKTAGTLGAISGAVGIVGSMKQGASAFLGSLAKGIGAILGPLGGIIGDLVDQIIQVFGQAPEAFRKMFIDLFKEIPQIISNIITNILNLPEIILEATTALVNEIPRIVLGIIDTIIDFISGEGIVDMAMNLIDALIDAIPTLIIGITERIPDIINTIIFFVPHIVVAIIRRIPDMIRKVVENIPTITRALAGTMPQVATSFIQEIPRIIDEFIKHIPEIVEELVKGIADSTTGGIGGAAGGFFEGVGDFFGGIFDKGGIVGAQNGVIVPGTRTSGDHQLIRANAREAVMTLEDQKEMFDILRGQKSAGPEYISVEVPVKIEEREIARVMKRVELNGWA